MCPCVWLQATHDLVRSRVSFATRLYQQLARLVLVEVYAESYLRQALTAFFAGFNAKGIRKNLFALKEAEKPGRMEKMSLRIACRFGQALQRHEQLRTPHHEPHHKCGRTHPYQKDNELKASQCAQMPGLDHVALQQLAET